MSGNDIIDITRAAAESNWNRKGFLEKIFTLQEQQYIRESRQPSKMVWRLWSMKESAYKIYTRQYGGRFFAPQKFHCTLLNDHTGKVFIREIRYNIVTRITRNYIYSIAKPAQFEKDPLLNHCFYSQHRDPATQHGLACKGIITRYAELTGEKEKHLSVTKDRNGIPFLFCRQERPGLPVSITHHGNYIAFTIC